MVGQNKLVVRQNQTILNAPITLLPNFITFILPPPPTRQIFHSNLTSRNPL
jgi:hypothetical protein